MLSDHERKAFGELEHQFQADDPMFARSFRTGEQRLARSRRRPASVGKIAIGVALWLSAFMLIVGQSAGAVAIAVFTGIIWAVWWTTQDSSRPPT